jgi:hypothetical protein
MLLDDGLGSISPGWENIALKEFTNCNVESRASEVSSSDL